MSRVSELIGKSFKYGERTLIIKKAKYTRLVGGFDEPIKRMVEVKTKPHEVIEGPIEQFEHLIANH